MRGILEPLAMFLATNNPHGRRLARAKQSLSKDKALRYKAWVKGLRMALSLAPTVEDEHESGNLAHQLAHCVALQELLADLPEQLHLECYVIPESHTSDDTASLERGSPFATSSRMSSPPA